MQWFLRLASLALLACCFASAGFAARVSSVVPANNARSVSLASTIRATFSATILTSSVNDTASFVVTGSVSGRHRGAFTFSGGNTVVTFTPAKPFLAGEVAVVEISAKVLDASSVPIVPAISIFTTNTNLSPGTIAAKTDYATGTRPWSVVASDVDGDGDADLVVANWGATTVSVLKNNGDGTFAAKTDYATGTNPQSVFLTDLDGDGDPDMVVANYSSATVSILKNNGNGVFGAKTDFATGLHPASVFVGDVDGDGYSDIAVANLGNSTVSILKNNGDGTFAARTDYPTGSSPQCVVISDVDGDGNGDLIVANYASNSVSILKNNGDGTFGAKTDYGTGYSPISIFVADLDGDGDGDLVVTNYFSNSVSIFKNNGDGTFAARTDYATGSCPGSVNIFDMDGDGDGDLVVSNEASASVSILKNNGDGTFAAKTDYPVGLYPRSVFVADLDGDGDGDLAVANDGSTTVSILKSTGYILTINAVNGTVAKNPNLIEYPGGASVTLSATGNIGYHFTGWSGDTVATANPIVISMSGNKTVTASFAVDSFTITSSAVNGTINPTPSVVVVYGANQRFSYAAATHYHLDSVLIDGAMHADSTSGYTFINVTAAHTIRVFYSINFFTIIVSPCLHGTTSPAGPVSMPYGSTQRFVPIPSANYHVDSLFVDNVSKPDSLAGYTFVNITANHAVRVVFRINPVTVTVSANARWNLISLPVYRAENGKSQAFPEATSSAFSYRDSAYTDETVLENGKGYWLKFATPVSVPLTGDPCDTLAVSVKAGWNLIGSVSDTVLATAITGSIGMSISPVWGYTGKYEQVDRLIPGKGYWVKAGEDGLLYLSAGNGFTGLGEGTPKRTRVCIVNSGELPPPPPVAGNELRQKGVPAVFKLEQAYPNPFNPAAIIRYQLPSAASVKLTVYNLLGQEVAVLVDAAQEAGYRQIAWDASGLASGMYFYRIESAALDNSSRRFTDTKKVMLLR